MEPLKKALIIVVCCTLAACAAIASDKPVVTEVDRSKYNQEGYGIVIAENIAPGQYAGDYSPSTAFEIIRPNLGPVTIGRVYTTSPVLRVAPSKKSFEDGERAIFLARNVKFTRGQQVQFYVEICSPVRTTLCYSVCVTSTRCVVQLCGPSYWSIGSIR